MKTFSVILFLILTCIKTVAQENEIDPIKIIISLVEDVAASGEEENSEVDLEQLYEQFANLLNNPVDLNTATRADLEQLYILSDFQISSVLEYIRNNGKMMSKYELAFVHGFDDALAESLYPFVSVASDYEYSARSDTAKFADMIRRGKHQIIVRTKQLLEKQAGYRDDATTKFRGTPLSLYARYTWQYSDRLKLNMTTEKDA
ncbi:MAG: helix-hairpin-helix domain-containing protein, partial [Prevotellaceae bacterium]|nr:helix-hairpin-helix domain-containing protein [Prevotellaceae bacterium]